MNWDKMKHYYKYIDGSIYFMYEQDVQFEITEPAILIDKANYLVLKVGNYSTCEKEMCKYELKGLTEYFNLEIIRIEFDIEKYTKENKLQVVELMNRLLHCTGYLETWLKEISNDK